MNRICVHLEQKWKWKQDLVHKEYSCGVKGEGKRSRMEEDSGLVVAQYYI